MLRANAHVHSPYSFSSFGTIEQIVKAAKAEGLRALGINDGATADGFGEFAAMCDRHRLYPLFNIEFLVRCEDFKLQKTLRNAPAETGFCYFCGKALPYPINLGPDLRNLLTGYWKTTQDYIWNLIGRLNGRLEQAGIACTLDFSDIRGRYARKNVNERHVARALYDALVKAYPASADFEAALVRLFGGISVTTRGLDPAAIQGELYGRLLTRGDIVPPALLKGQYLRLSEAHALVLGAGGVPCYSVDVIAVREFSQCSSDAERLAEQLRQLKIWVVDFFPLRTETEILKTYVRVFSSRNFCITFGTGHNEPERRPLMPRLFGGGQLDEELSRIGWEGACLLAGHQELRKQNKEGIVDGRGNWLVTPETRKNIIAIGEKAIQKATE